MSLVCITNEMVAVRGCTLRAQHTTACTGFNRDGGDCLGCLPRPAQHGLLCWSCWERLENVMARWEYFADEVRKLAAELTPAVTADTAGRSSTVTGYIPIPHTTLTLNECEHYLKTFTGDPAVWVSSFDGARDSVVFTRVAEKAYKAHPLAEEPHRLPKTFCTECKTRSLIWYPPQFVGDEVKVICAECGKQLSQSSYNLLAHIEETEKTND